MCLVPCLEQTLKEHRGPVVHLVLKVEFFVMPEMALRRSVGNGVLRLFCLQRANSCCARWRFSSSNPTFSLCSQHGELHVGGLHIAVTTMILLNVFIF